MEDHPLLLHSLPPSSLSRLNNRLLLFLDGKQTDGDSRGRRRSTCRAPAKRDCCHPTCRRASVRLRTMMSLLPGRTGRRQVTSRQTASKAAGLESGRRRGYDGKNATCCIWYTCCIKRPGKKKHCLGATCRADDLRRNSSNLPTTPGRVFQSPGGLKEGSRKTGALHAEPNSAENPERWGGAGLAEAIKAGTRCY